MNTDPEKFLSIVKSQEYEGMILLGAAGLRLTQILSNQTKIPIVTGSNNITTQDTGLTGVSILTDPFYLLEFIHQLLPHHTNIIQITNPEKEGGYLQNLREQAKTIGIQLIVVEANNLQEATRQYDSLLPRLNKNRDIVWLPMNPDTMETGTLFPAVLMKAWEYKIPIVSPTISHTGVMIGAYPAPQAYGRQIANLLLAYIQEASIWKPKVEYAKQLNLTYNEIFASHLGIQLPVSLRQRVFKLYE